MTGKCIQKDLARFVHDLNEKDFSCNKFDEINGENSGNGLKGFSTLKQSENDGTRHKSKSEYGDGSGIENIGKDRGAGKEYDDRDKFPSPLLSLGSTQIERNSTLAQRLQRLS